MQLFGSVSQQAFQVTHKAVDVALAGRLVDDVFVVVVAQTATQLLVVHLGLVFPLAPSACHLQVRETGVRIMNEIHSRVQPCCCLTCSSGASV